MRGSHLAELWSQLGFLKRLLDINSMRPEETCPRLSDSVTSPNLQYRPRSIVGEERIATLSCQMETNDSEGFGPDGAR
jgi:hypothetical protein